MTHLEVPMFCTEGQWGTKEGLWGTKWPLVATVAGETNMYLGDCQKGLDTRGSCLTLVN